MFYIESNISPKASPKPQARGARCQAESQCPKRQAGQRRLGRCVAAAGLGDPVSWPSGSGPAERGQKPTALLSFHSLPSQAGDPCPLTLTIDAGVLRSPSGGEGTFPPRISVSQACIIGPFRKWPTKPRGARTLDPRPAGMGSGLRLLPPSPGPAGNAGACWRSGRAQKWVFVWLLELFLGPKKETDITKRWGTPY